MQSLINEIYLIIKDFREDESSDFMTHGIIEAWITQFDEEDQQFVLEELKHILQTRYISKNNAKLFLDNMVTNLAKQFHEESPKSFLQNCYFIDHQPDGKSQKVFLSLLDGIAQEKYGISITNFSDLNPPKYYIYLDDILCTGDTLFKGLAKNTDESKGWFFKKNIHDITNLSFFQETKAKFIFAFFATHSYNYRKVINRIYMALGKKDIKPILYAELIIDNDYESPSSSLAYLYPQNKDLSIEAQDCAIQIEKKVIDYHNKYKLPPPNFYRQKSIPKESFFSSEENRNRFEKIILQKSIELYNKANNANIRMRPLGYGLQSDISFGFGTLVFSWRNVPFNVPMIFWYPYNNFSPLFQRNFITYSNSAEEKELE